MMRTVLGIGAIFLFGGRRRPLRGTCARPGGGWVRLKLKKKRPIAESSRNLHLAQNMMLRFVAIDA